MAVEDSDSAKKPDISVMLTGFKRLRRLPEQIEAVRSQTIPPVAVWLYHNSHRKFELSDIPDGVDRVITSHPNLGVWPRFMSCMEFETDYVCVFDDDTVPGKKWFENCWNSMQKQEGLYGTNGIIFPLQGRRPYSSIGWKGNRRETTEVDIVGHSWFFKRDWLRYYAFLPRPMGKDGKTGKPVHLRTGSEDYHFSVTLQAMGLGTYVPPHPEDKQELWGSLKGGYGRDKHALWKSKAEERKKAAVHEMYRNAGWALVKERGKGDAGLARSKVHLFGNPANWQQITGAVPFQV